MYVCQFVRLLIPFVVAAPLLTMSPSILRLLLEGCRRLSRTDLFDNHILRVKNVVTKGLGNTRTYCMCVGVCVSTVSVSVCFYGCMVGGIEGD